MRALLLAAGRATRLGNLSATTPKCLQVIGSEVLLDRLVRQLHAVGVSEFVVNTHHLAEIVAEHVSTAWYREMTTLVFEPDLLGTLGTLRRNSSILEDDSCWVLHADNYIEGDLTALARAHERLAPDLWGCMLTFQVTNPREYGVVQVDERGVLVSFDEKVEDPPSPMASAATFVFEPAVSDLMAALPRTACDISRDLLPRLTSRMQTVVHPGRVIDIGTPQGLASANSLAAPRDAAEGT